MALFPWTPEKGLSGEKVMRPASVSTSLSLELCTFPSTLGSSVAATALEQLLAVEQSLQGDYFKCNEEIRTFLKDIAAAVKKLEEMRKNTIDRLEIESMEMSRLYFLLETVPDSLNREVEECIKNARRLNLSEINHLKAKIAKMDNEAMFLKKRIAELRDANETLGQKQEGLAKKHVKFVLALNHTMEEKAMATVSINETYTKIKLEKEEIVLQKQCLREATELMEKHKAEYTAKKQQITSKINTLREDCVVRSQEMHNSKIELNRLQAKMTKMKQAVTSNTVILSDSHLEKARLQKAIRDWSKRVEDIKKDCKNLESKTRFFMSHRETLDDASTNEKNDYVQKINQMAEKFDPMQVENKQLQEKLQNLLKQLNIVLNEENAVHLQKQKILEENENQVAFINHKEALLSQRKVDIKNMEDGFIMLEDLHRATKHEYTKQIKLLSENLAKEKQKWVITQWHIASLKKKHARWLEMAKAEVQTSILKVKDAERRRTDLIEETNVRETEINNFVEQIQKLTVEVKEEEKEFVNKEKQLLQELIMYEDLITKEEQLSKAKEEELINSLPQLQEAEECFVEKHRAVEEVKTTLQTQKREEKSLNNYIGHFKEDLKIYSNSTERLKQELKQLREKETKKAQEHFEILRTLENEIYAHDLKTDLLILENERLKEHIAKMKEQVEKYRNEQETAVKDTGDRSWELIVGHKRYSQLLADFQVGIKELVDLGEETLQEIKHLIDKLYYMDERIDSISKWLQGNIQRLHSLIDQESLKDLPKQRLSDIEQIYQYYVKRVHFLADTGTRTNALTKDCKDTNAEN